MRNQNRRGACNDALYLSVICGCVNQVQPIALYLFRDSCICTYTPCCVALLYSCRMPAACPGLKLGHPSITRASPQHHPCITQASPEHHPCGSASRACLYDMIDANSKPVSDGCSSTHLSCTKSSHSPKLVCLTKVFCLEAVPASRLNPCMSHLGHTSTSDRLPDLNVSLHSFWLV